jgi:hypothetical protein
MQEITRVRALCCECGNLRTVSANYGPPRDGNHSVEGCADPRGWRVTGTLKCSICKVKTRHALLRDGDKRRDSAEPPEHRCADLPLAAGATEVTDWSRSPNGRAYNRWFRSKSLPVMRDWLTVHTGGIEIVEDSGAHTIIRTVLVEQTTGTGVLVPEHALKLAATLEDAATHTAQLEATDTQRSCGS